MQYRLKMEAQQNENSYKTIINSTSIFGIAQFMKIFISVISTKIIAVFLGPIGIGLIGLINNSTSIISSITSFGINITSVRDLSIANSKKDQQLFDIEFTKLQRWCLFTGFFGAIMSIVFSKYLSKITFGNFENFYWFILLSVNFILVSLTICRIAVLQSKRMLRKIAISNILITLFSSLCSLPIYYFFKSNGIIPVLLISATIGLLVNIYFTRNIKKVKLNDSLSDILKDSITKIKLGFLLSINVIFGLICTFIIKLYLNQNGQNSQILGFFEVSSVIILTYFGLVFNAMSTDFYPRITTINNDNSKSNALVNDQIEIGLLIITPIICLVYFTAPFLIEILYTKDFHNVIYILKAALMAVLIKTITWPFGFLILAKSETKMYFWQEIISDLFLLIATFLGFHFFGLQGIGMASLLQFSTYGFFIYLIINKKYNFKFRNNTKFVIFVSVSLGMINCLFSFLIDYPNCNLPMGFVLLCSILFSYKELNKRINFYSYYFKLKNKLFKNTPPLQP